MTTRPPLYVFSPLPPSRNGIADYTLALIEALETYYTCIPVISDDAPEPDWPGTLYLCEYERLSAAIAGERHLYQIGNNAGHIYFLPWLERVPGVVTVHDATMAHMLDWATSHGAGGGRAYRQLAEAAHGPSGRAMLDHAVDGGLWGGSLGQELSFLPLFLQPAWGIIAHSKLVLYRAAAAAPGVQVHLIPHFAQIGATFARKSSDQTLRMLCLGFPSRAKRLDLVLGALAILRANGVPAALTIAGEVRPEEVDIEAIIAALHLEHLVEITGYVSEQHMAELLGAADVVVNLRDPTSGESSGTLARAMAAGVCALVTDVGTYAEYPDNTVVKLARYQMDEGALAQCLWQLHAEPARRNAIARAGQDFVHRTCSLERVAAAYHTAIEAAYRDPAPAGRPIRSLDLARPAAMLDFEQEAERTGALSSRFQLFWRERLLPLARGEGAGLATIGVDQGLVPLIHGCFGWHCDNGPMKAEIAALLALLDERNRADANRDCVELVAKAGRLRSGGTVTVEVANEAVLRGQLDDRLGQLGFRLLREARGPSLPLFSVDFQGSLPSGWAATYVRCAADTQW